MKGKANLLLSTVLFMSSCQLPQNPKQENFTEARRTGTKVSTPQFQRAENRQKRMKNDLRLLGAASLVLLAKFLSDSPKEERGMTDQERERETWGTFWREGVEKPAKKAYKKVFD